VHYTNPANSQEKLTDANKAIFVEYQNKLKQIRKLAELISYANRFQKFKNDLKFIYLGDHRTIIK